MKVALITDTHFGARSDSIPFDNFFNKFYTEVFFPHLEREQIKTIIHLGDVFDRRKYINFNTLKKCKEYFFDRTTELGIDVHMIAGNHDTFFKNTNEVNSLDLLLREYGNVITYSDAEEIKLMEDFVQGTMSENTMRLIGKLSPTGNGLMQALNIGAIVNNPAFAVATISGAAAKAGAEGKAVKSLDAIRNMITSGMAPEKRGLITDKDIITLLGLQAD